MQTYCEHSRFLPPESWQDHTKGSKVDIGIFFLTHLLENQKCTTSPNLYVSKDMFVQIIKSGLGAGPQ